MKNNKAKLPHKNSISATAKKYKMLKERLFHASILSTYFLAGAWGMDKDDNADWWWHHTTKISMSSSNKEASKKKNSQKRGLEDQGQDQANKKRRATQEEDDDENDNLDIGLLNVSNNSVPSSAEHPSAFHTTEPFPDPLADPSCSLSLYQEYFGEEEQGHLVFELNSSNNANSGTPGPLQLPQSHLTQQLPNNQEGCDLDIYFSVVGKEAQPINQLDNTHNTNTGMLQYQQAPSPPLQSAQKLMQPQPLSPQPFNINCVLSEQKAVSSSLQPDIQQMLIYMQMLQNHLCQMHQQIQMLSNHLWHPQQTKTLYYMLPEQQQTPPAQFQLKLQPSQELVRPRPQQLPLQQAQQAMQYQSLFSQQSPQETQYWPPLPPQVQIPMHQPLNSQQQIYSHQNQPTESNTHYGTQRTVKVNGKTKYVQVEDEFWEEFDKIANKNRISPDILLIQIISGITPEKTSSGKRWKQKKSEIVRVFILKQLLQADQHVNLLPMRNESVILVPRLEQEFRDTLQKIATADDISAERFVKKIEEKIEEEKIKLGNDPVRISQIRSITLLVRLHILQRLKTGKWGTVSLYRDGQL